MHASIRSAAVAGTFYPGSASTLEDAVAELLRAANDARASAAPRCPNAIIVPHAGYVYSGPVAASAFARVAPFGGALARVVLIGPAHRTYVDGLAWPGAGAMRTPLGDVAIDTDALALVPEVRADAEAHRREHSLEVELPFLQKIAPRAKLVPLVVGRASPEQVGRVLEALWGGAETLIVVSTDLSHYLPYDRGRVEDEATAARIVALDPRPLEGDEACGAAGVNGLVWVARRKGLRVELVDRRSSGDTAGPRDEVVGYGAFALYESEAA